MSIKLDKAVEAVGTINEFCEEFENILRQQKLELLGKGGDGDNTLSLFAELDKLGEIIRGIRTNNNGNHKLLDKVKSHKLYPDLLALELR